MKKQLRLVPVFALVLASSSLPAAAAQMRVQDGPISGVKAVAMPVTVPAAQSIGALAPAAAAPELPADALALPAPAVAADAEKAAAAQPVFVDATPLSPLGVAVTRAFGMTPNFSRAVLLVDKETAEWGKSEVSATAASEKKPQPTKPLAVMKALVTGILPNGKLAATAYRATPRMTVGYDVILDYDAQTGKFTTSELPASSGVHMDVLAPWRWAAKNAATAIQMHYQDGPSAGVTVLSLATGKTQPLPVVRRSPRIQSMFFKVLEGNSVSSFIPEQPMAVSPNGRFAVSLGAMENLYRLNVEEGMVSRGPQPAQPMVRFGTRYADAVVEDDGLVTLWTKNGDQYGFDKDLKISRHMALKRLSGGASVPEIYRVSGSPDGRQAVLVHKRGVSFVDYIRGTVTYHPIKFPRLTRSGRGVGQVRWEKETVLLTPGLWATAGWWGEPSQDSQLIRRNDGSMETITLNTSSPAIPYIAEVKQTQRNDVASIQVTDLRTGIRRDVKVDLNDRLSAAVKHHDIGLMHAAVSPDGKTIAVWNIYRDWYRVIEVYEVRPDGIGKSIQTIDLEHTPRMATFDAAGSALIVSNHNDTMFGSVTAYPVRR